MTTGEIARRALGKRYMTMGQIAEEYPDGVTLNGFRYEMVKGKRVAAYTTEEGGCSFLSSGKLLSKLTEEYEAVYESESAIDVALARNPVRIKIHELATLPSGRRFRLVEYLGTIDAETGELLSDKAQND